MNAAKLRDDDKDKTVIERRGYELKLWKQCGIWQMNDTKEKGENGWVAKLPGLRNDRDVNCRVNVHILPSLAFPFSR